MTVGAGAATTTLSYSGGKVSALTLALVDASGVQITATSGASPLVLDRTLAAGTYRYVVSGDVAKGSVSFALSVRHAAT